MFIFSKEFSKKILNSVLLPYVFYSWVRGLTKSFNEIIAADNLTFSLSEESQGAQLYSCNK